MTLQILRHLMTSLSASASDGLAARCAEVRNGFDRTHFRLAATKCPLGDVHHAPCLPKNPLCARTHRQLCFINVDTKLCSAQLKEKRETSFLRAAFTILREDYSIRPCLSTTQFLQEVS